MGEDEFQDDGSGEWDLECSDCGVVYDPELMLHFDHPQEVCPHCFSEDVFGVPRA